MGTGYKLARNGYLLLLAVLCLAIGSGISHATDTSNPLLGNLIPAATINTWSQAGIAGGIPAVTPGVNVKDFGATANDDRDDSRAFQQAIDSVSGKTDNAIYVPAGTYHLNKGLVIHHSAVLRGAGPELTTLISSAASDAILVTARPNRDWVKLKNSVQKAERTLTFADTQKFDNAAYIEVRQQNDPDLMYTKPKWDKKWAKQAVGQVLPVSAITRQSIQLAQPLGINFLTRQNATVRAIEVVTDVGIEELTINRQQAQPNAGYTINWKYAARVWLRNVHSEWAAPNHVKAASVHDCEIRDSYFHHASSYATGGKGYGVNLARHATNCLIENNVFHNLRHSMLLHLGANSHVLAYNFSDHSHDHRGKTLPDIALHGHYPFANLFEGNIVNEIAYGDFWGPAGPGNVSFRNCVTAEGIWLQDESHSQIIVGNQLIDTPGNAIYQRDESVINHIVVGLNTVAVDQTGEHTRHLGQLDSSTVLPKSLYRSDTPDFYSTTYKTSITEIDWPSTGTDSSHGCINPASQWLEDYLHTTKYD